MNHIFKKTETSQRKGKIETPVKVSEQLLEALNNVDHDLNDNDQLIELINKRLEELSSEMSRIDHNLKAQDNNRKFGRRLLSVDDDQTDYGECETDHCNRKSVRDEDDDFEDNDVDDDMEVKGSDENDGNDNDETDYDDEEETEDEDDDDESDYEDALLDSDEVTALLEGSSFDEQITIMNNLLDEAEAILRDTSDSDVYVSAVQSLIVYRDFVEEITDEKQEEPGDAVSAILTKINKLKMLYLSQISHFEIFLEKAWTKFDEIMNLGELSRKSKETVKLINEFAFNMHYTLEIKKIIINRGIEDELEIVQEYSESVDIMEKAFNTLGFGDTMEKEVMNSDNSFKKRSLLSLDMKDVCEKDDIDCERRSKESLKEFSKNNVKTSTNKDEIIEKMSKELQEDYQKAKNTKKRHDKMSGVSLCQELLHQTKNELKQSELIQDKIDFLKELSPRKKLDLIKKMMVTMSSVRSLLNEYKSISSSLTSSDDITLCQPILKVF